MCIRDRTLTQASHVIHVDRWWNPAVENQATDRAYRIGQHRITDTAFHLNEIHAWLHGSAKQAVQACLLYTSRCV